MMQRSGCSTGRYLMKTIPVRRVLLLFVVGVLTAMVSRAKAADITNAMNEDPKFPPRQIEKIFQPQLVDLWLGALQHPEADLQREAAETIAAAHKQGMLGLDAATPHLIKVLQSQRNSLVKLSAARSLITLDARSSSEALWTQSQAAGRDFARVIEPALAAWKFAPARSAWLERIGSSESQSPQLLKIAMESLALAGEQEAGGLLLKWAHDPSARADVRLVAARAARDLQQPGPLEKIQQLAGPKQNPSRLIDRLVAATLLQASTVPGSLMLTQQLATDGEPAVAVIALQRLYDLDPEHVLELADSTLQRPDVKLRTIVAQALVARPTPERMPMLGTLLADVNPNLRRWVQTELIELASQEALNAPVRQAGMQALSQEAWQGRQEACLLLCVLRHEPAAARVAELLWDDRGEVQFASAWGLGRMAVPATYAKMDQRAKEQTEFLLRLPKDFSDPPIPVKQWYEINDQLSYLFQSIGMVDHEPSDPTLRKFFDKDPRMTIASRSAAVWALGKLHVDDPEPKLVEQLEGRLSDMALVNPEMTEVRALAAIGLARMQSKSSEKVLRRFFSSEGPDSAIGQACSWALEQLTGEKLPGPTVFRPVQRDWFLEPFYPTGTEPKPTK